jgi:hypothetical protein
MQGDKINSDWVQKENERIVRDILHISGITPDEFQNLCYALIPILVQADTQGCPVKFTLLGFNIERK